MKYENAVILLNMGGPNSLDEVSSFLKNMFSDPCILSIKNSMFRSILGSIIVNNRIEKSKKIYQALGGASPITQITFSLIKKLQKIDSATFYTYAMRYSTPYCYNVLKEVQEKNINNVVLFSMYPQYSTTTTLSSFNDVLYSLKKLNFEPSVSIVERYYNNKLFIDSIANSLQKTLNGSNPSDFTLILSAHSIPVSRVKKGDPYQNECEICSKALQQTLEERGIRFQEIILSYQSKVGPVKWIGPETQDIIRQKTNKNVMIYPISFSIDNSETLYELCIQYKDIANEVGIRDYRVCPCLNDSDDFIELILNLTKANKESHSQIAI
ncbi:ferrochelatase [Helicobacter muridarum]|uniref:Ferrochelatase n=1 Tax=Helicobacter muridarum TaxID=216 RepID=A0A377PU41_9HELI|nr:ferrochelatase [Helicobacter muridarum]TLE00493.1 ferrochelatase [Helicobacter muridarum]STQ86468.1 ferrochelatase [Helicobacter muridarum]